MPDLDFVLPHWLYWLGLIAFPLIAMMLVRRTQAVAAERGRTTVGVAYLLLLTGGFVGLHRFYLRSPVGAVYVLLFIGILYANAEQSSIRAALSEAKADIVSSEYKVEIFQGQVDKGRDGAQKRLDDARAVLAEARGRIDGLEAGVATIAAAARVLAIAIALGLAVDLFLIPSITRRAREKDDPAADATGGSAESGEAPSRAPPPATGSLAAVVNAVEGLSRRSGEFVAYWSVIAVFVYFYEVIARYVFNSPTNWAHESMFLVFGMQYLVSGAYAYMTDSHVRVDVFYARFSPRGKAVSDILTSVFFFIFAGTLLVTSWIFAADAMKLGSYRDAAELGADTGSLAVLFSGVVDGAFWAHLANRGEVSFTEWAIQYWPVKVVMALGALLIVLQGVAKLLRDIAVLIAGPAGHTREV